MVKARRGTVYFLRPVGMACPIKIGFTTSLRTRLAMYRTHSPVPLELVGRFEATVELEESLLRRFSHHGEWFNPNAGLVRLVEALQRREARGARKRLERHLQEIKDKTRVKKCP